MTIAERRLNIQKHMEAQEKSLKEWHAKGCPGEFHSTRLDDERALVVLGIAETMSNDEIKRIKAIPAWETNWQCVSDIKKKYGLSWNELKSLKQINFKETSNV